MLHLPSIFELLSVKLNKLEKSAISTFDDDDDDDDDDDACAAV